LPFVLILILPWGDLFPSGEPVIATLLDVPFEVKHYIEPPRRQERQEETR